MSFHIESAVHRDHTVPILFTIDTPSRNYIRNDSSMIADEITEGHILCTAGDGYLHLEIEGTYDNAQPVRPPDPEVPTDENEIRYIATHRIQGTRRVLRFRLETRGISQDESRDDPVTLTRIQARFTLDGRPTVDGRR